MNNEQETSQRERLPLMRRHRKREESTIDLSMQVARCLSIRISGHCQTSAVRRYRPAAVEILFAFHFQANSERSFIPHESTFAIFPLRPLSRKGTRWAVKISSLDSTYFFIWTRNFLSPASCLSIELVTFHSIVRLSPERENHAIVIDVPFRIELITLTIRTSASAHIHPAAGQCDQFQVARWKYHVLTSMTSSARSMLSGSTTG